MTTTESIDVDALRSTGGGVHVRTARLSDQAALIALHVATSDRSIYLRFFAADRKAAADYIPVLLQPNTERHHALVALVNGNLVGAAAWELTEPGTAEIGLLVADQYQHQGIGTLLIEYLSAVARRVGITRFTAEVLVSNGLMIGTLRDLGFQYHAHTEYGVTTFSLDLTSTPVSTAAIEERDGSADAASLSALLAPASVTVIGAGREGSVGYEVLRNILAGGYRGQVSVVNPHRREVLGIAAFPAVADLPELPELAVIAVPAAAVLEVVAECGRLGVRGVLVLSAGFDEIGSGEGSLQTKLAGVVRQHGMRMLGPNCLGVLNADPAVRLNATFAALSMHTGAVAVASQSGALGIAVLNSAARCGLGVTQFVSMGNKADVSGNDLLLRWERDPQVRVIGLYLESLGNAARFAGIARRVSDSKPVVVLKAGRSEAGRRAGLSHTAAAASNDVVVDALFERAGVIRVDSMATFVDALRVLNDQPLPDGPRVAIVGNSGGPGILAADAATVAGLAVTQLSDHLRAAVQAAADTAASTQNPIDLGAGVQPAQVQAVIGALLASDELDAVLGVFTETLVADHEQLMSAVGLATAGSAKPVLIAQVGQSPRTVPVPGTPRTLTLFEFPEPAAAALGVLWKYARSRRASRPDPIRPAGLDQAGARALIAEQIAEGAGWLTADVVARLLRCYDIALCGQRIVHTTAQAADAVLELGLPVVLKFGDSTVHKSEAGGVRTNLNSTAEVLSAFASMTEANPGPLLMQQMVGSGVEIILGGLHDDQFGPVVMVGTGGVLADVINDRGFQLAPLDRSTALATMGGLKLARLLAGYRGGVGVSQDAVADLLVRFSFMMSDNPELAEVDLNPVIGRGDELLAVDGKVRLALQAPLVDEHVRTLRPAGR